MGGGGGKKCHLVNKHIINGITECWGGGVEGHLGEFSAAFELLFIPRPICAKVVPRVVKHNIL